MPVATDFPINGVAGVDFSRVDSVQKHPLGWTLHSVGGTLRKYVRAGATVAQYDALTYDSEGINDWQPTSGANQGVYGVCPVSGVADNYFFWAIIKGKANVKVAATITAGAHLASTATAGTLDDVAAAAADAQAAASGVGVIAFLDDSPSAGIALVHLQ